MKPNMKITLSRTFISRFQVNERNNKSWKFLFQTVSGLGFAHDLQKQRDRWNLFHFAMRLRSEFEALCMSNLQRHPLPSLTEVVAEFISTETRLRILSPSSAPA